MSDQHIYNTFNIHGDHNVVNFTQHIQSGTHAGEIIGMVIKFMWGITGLLLSPILIPLILGANGVKLLQERRAGGDQ